MTEHMHYDEDTLRILQNSGVLRNDNGESIWTARQLEYVASQAYDIKRPALMAMDLFPINSEVPEGARNYTYEQYDTVGAAKLISAYADDLPRSDIVKAEFTSNIRGVGGSYGYNVDEIRHARMENINLTTRKMMAARRSHDEKMNRLAWFGDSDAGIPGFLTNPNIPGYTVPADGTGSSKLWSTKTADLILRDMNAIVRQVKTQSKGVHRATELWLPLEQYGLAMEVRSTSSDLTVLEAFRRSNPDVTVREVIELENALGGGTLDTMVAIENDPMNYEMIVPMMFLQHPPQERNLEFVVNCEGKTGGTVVYYPFAMAIADSI